MTNNLLLIVSFVVGLGLGFSAHRKLAQLLFWAARHRDQAAILIIGLCVGAFSYHGLTTLQEYRRENEGQVEVTWNATYNDEGKVHERMLQLQSALEALKTDGTAKNTEVLSKEAELLSKTIEMQAGIDDLLIKFREMQHVKYDWLSGMIGAIGGALVTAVVTVLPATRRPQNNGV